MDNREAGRGWGLGGGAWITGGWGWSLNYRGRGGGGGGVQEGREVCACMCTVMGGGIYVGSMILKVYLDTKGITNHRQTQCTQVLVRSLYG